MASQGTFLLCRLCLVKREFLIDIFQIANRLYTVAEVIIELLQLHVRENDGYSKFVCLRCCDKLFGFKEFKGLCLQAKETFEKKFLPLLNSEAENERRGTNQMVESPNCSSSSDNTDNAEETELPSVEEINTIFVPSVVPVKEDPGEDRADNWTSLLNNEGIDHVTGLTSREENNRLSAPSEARERWRPVDQRGMADGAKGDETEDACQVTTPAGRAAARRSSRGRQACQPTESASLVCDLCGHRSSDEQELCQHITRRDCDRASFTCEVCDKAFSGNRSLVRHRTAHGGAKALECPTCGKCFRRKHHLTAHAATHSGLKPFVCGDCGNAFTRKHILATHEMTHSGERPFRCEACGKGFTQRTHLTMHTMTHTGLRPYKCDTCGKGFTQRHDLTVHTRTHTGLKPYGCPACGREFNQKQNLNMHLRTHTGLRPFKCETCGVAFRVKRSLDSHLATHTGQ